MAFLTVIMMMKIMITATTNMIMNCRVDKQSMMIKKEMQSSSP